MYIWATRGSQQIHHQLTNVHLSAFVAKGLFTSWTMKLSHIIGQFSMVQYLKLHFRSLWPLTMCKLNVDQEKRPRTKKWIHQFFLIYFKKGNFGNFLRVWPSPLQKGIFFIFVLVTMKTFDQKKIKIKKSMAFLYHGPLTLQRENLFCLSHYKTLWSTTMHNVGLEINLSGTSSSMVTLTFFFLM